MESLFVFGKSVIPSVDVKSERFEPTLLVSCYLYELLLHVRTDIKSQQQYEIEVCCETYQEDDLSVSAAQITTTKSLFLNKLG